MQKKLIILSSVFFFTTAAFAGLSGWLWFQLENQKTEARNLEQSAQKARTL